MKCVVDHRENVVVMTKSFPQYEGHPGQGADDPRGKNYLDSWYSHSECDVTLHKRINPKWASCTLIFNCFRISLNEWTVLDGDINRVELVHQQFLSMNYKSDASIVFCTGWLVESVTVTHCCSEIRTCENGEVKKPCLWTMIETDLSYSPSEMHSIQRPVPPKWELVTAGLKRTSSRRDRIKFEVPYLRDQPQDCVMVHWKRRNDSFSSTRMTKLCRSSGLRSRISRWFSCSWNRSRKCT